MGVLRTLVIAIALLVACRPDHGPPRVKKLPTKSVGPALRGGGTPKSPRIASYTINATLDPLKHQVTATSKLTWTNAGQSAVDMLPFHLYLNAFKNEKTAFWKSARGEMRRAHAATDSGWGWISLESVQIGTAELVTKLQYPGRPDDETVVNLPLPEAVQPGSTIEVTFKFTAQLPEVYARTGYKEDFHLIGQWFPKVGVRVGTPGAEQWYCNTFTVTTEFFADFGNYDVKLTVPNTHIVAATGILTDAVDNAGGTRTLTYHAEDVHDFVWMADPHMTMTREGYISGVAKPDNGPPVEVRVYARPEQAEFARRHLQAAIGAIERFSEYFVPYPWPIMNVIDPPKDAEDGAGGMEYPMFVTTGGDTWFTRKGVRLPEYVTVHEVGHNWFQGIFASNEAEEAWLDEGVNEWADAHVMRDLYGPRVSGVDWLGWQADIVALRSTLRGLDTSPAPIATAAYAFPDARSYGLATYDGTMNALLTLEAFVGSAKFLAAMKKYAQTYAFKHPTGRDFFTTLNTELGDVSWFLNPAFHDVGGHRLELRDARCRSVHVARGVFGDGPQRKTVSDTPEAGTYTCEVTVQNTGAVHMPVDIELKFEDGSTMRVQWNDRGQGSWHRFEFQRSSKLAEVRIDPDRKLLLGNPTTYYTRVEGDGAASLRASARIATWAQTLMQLVGP